MNWEIVYFYVDEFDHDKIKARVMCQYHNRADAQKDLEKYQMQTCFGYCKIRAVNKG